MKAISIQQPWAWVIFHGKPVENRSWATHYKGDLLIHASSKFDIKGYRWLFNHQWLLDTRLFDVIQDKENKFPFGCIIGKVTMTDCIVYSSSSWFSGPYGHLYKDPVEFKKPIPFKGALKFFEVPDKLLKGLL